MSKELFQELLKVSEHFSSLSCILKIKRVFPEKYMPASFKCFPQIFCMQVLLSNFLLFLIHTPITSIQLIITQLLGDVMLLSLIPIQN